jgi:hypothetical protein
LKTNLPLMIFGSLADAFTPAAVIMSLVLFDLAFCGNACADENTRDAIDAPKAEYFTEHVLPLLREHCFDCHSHESGEANGKLMLDTLAAITDGGTRGAAIVPGKADESILIRALSHSDTDLQMPPDEKLPDEQIAVLRQWISDGAIVPENRLGKAHSKIDRSAEIIASHWAYQPVRREGKSIEELVASRLRDSALALSPRASRRTLIRRLNYDLIGLPPTLEEIVNFERDPLSDRESTSALIERLLASPHFGERWARYWMDVARYADNKGYVFQEDREYAGAYRYRDWLINAFNADMPYDQFVTKQLAADLLDSPDPNDLPALGFLTLGRRFLNNKQDIIDDRLDVVARGLMGMTLGCARCHDHKYDPISQADYYSMAGIFLNTDEPGGEPWPHQLKDASDNRQAFILIRGNAHSRGDKVDRRFVNFLDPDAQPMVNGSGRTELAQKIVAADNPLTSRVMANRVWMRLMGSSLVESPSDLGTRCGQPVQLDLLDQLASSFIDSGWSVKQLIRQIVNSEVYQQQSLDRSECSQIDPQNSFYWRMNRRRLDFEAFRDTLLVCGHLLDLTLHGPSQKIDGNDLMRRRAVYAYIDRQNLPSVFRTFDFASPDTHNAGRPQTSVPQQGLFSLNSNFIARVAERMGSDAQASSGTNEDDAKIQGLFTQTLARTAAPEELQLAREFLAGAGPSATSVARPLWVYGYAAFNAETRQLSNFQALPTFKDNVWQGGEKLPDETLGWCMLNATGGHVGNDLEHAVVKRWIAPRDGTLRISGKLEHKSDQGDGVRASVFVAGDYKNQWRIKNGEVEVNVAEVSINAGETVDFVTDCIESPSHDSFSWSIRLRYTNDRSKYNAQDELPLPQPEPLDRWAQLAQILLATNELAFVD